MILINPASGKFKGQELFEKLIGPTFQMAGVETDVTGESLRQRGSHLTVGQACLGLGPG